MIFRNEYWFLSNMYPCDVEIIIQGKKMNFKCVESAYQAQKNPNEAYKFVNFDGFEAKKLGKTVPLSIDNWNTVGRIIAMKQCLESKFSNATLKAKLIAIKEPIIESNVWGDTFWGISHNKGKNILGLMLEQLKVSNKINLDLILPLIK